MSTRSWRGRSIAFAAGVAVGSGCASPPRETRVEDRVDRLFEAQWVDATTFVEVANLASAWHDRDAQAFRRFALARLDDDRVITLVTSPEAPRVSIAELLWMATGAEGVPATSWELDGVLTPHERERFLETLRAR